MELPGFPQDFRLSVGICAHSVKRAFVRSLVLDAKAWLAIDIPIDPKVPRWGWGQGSVQATGVASTPNSSKHAFMKLALCTGSC